MKFIYIFSFVSVIFLLPINQAFASEAPILEDGLLTIPTVNTPNQVGQYQDITFKFTDQNGWQLLDFKELGTQELGLVTMIEGVELVKTDTFPVQVLLRVSGYFSGGCTSLGQINHQLEDDQFEIFIHSNHPPGIVACPADIVFHRITISLPVYGLSAGTYTYSINGGNNGTFALAEDNKLPGDCEDTCQDVELTF